MSDGVAALTTLAGLSQDISDLVQRSMSSVVSLSGVARDLSEAWGSGFVFDDAGHLVTNFHVVEGRVDAMRGNLPQSEHRPVKVIGVDPVTDLAVLAFNEGGTPHLELRDRPAELGELCLALGSPLGVYTESVAMGIVSGLGRSLARTEGQRPLEHAIQTDAAINHGNSGGPLIDVQGLVIGVNQSGIEDAQGINFAVPAQIVGTVVRELISHGEVQRAALGVAVAEQPVAVEGSVLPRLRVIKVGDAGSTLRVGDVLLQVDGVPIHDRGDLFGVLSRDRIGKAIPIDVYRDETRTTLSIVPKTLAPD